MCLLQDLVAAKHRRAMIQQALKSSDWIRQVFCVCDPHGQGVRVCNGQYPVFVTASTVLVPAGCPCHKPWVVFVVFLDATSLIIFSDFGQSHLYLILPTHILLKLTFCVAVS